MTAAGLLQASTDSVQPSVNPHGLLKEGGALVGGRFTSPRSWSHRPPTPAAHPTAWRAVHQSTLEAGEGSSGFRGWVSEGHRGSSAS